jgi:hypothetical protein
LPTRTLYTSTALEVLTSANFEKMSKGAVAYVKSTSTQSGITSETVITGTSLSPTLPTDRLIKVTAGVEVAGTQAGDNCRLYLYVDSVQEASVDLEVDTTRQSVILPGVPFLLTAGAHTFNLSLARVTGTGTIATGASGHGILMLIEDIGPAFT